jgi:hypothetical protein
MVVFWKKRTSVSVTELGKCFPFEVLTSSFLRSVRKGRLLECRNWD